MRPVGKASRRCLTASCRRHRAGCAWPTNDSRGHVWHVHGRCESSNQHQDRVACQSRHPVRACGRLSGRPRRAAPRSSRGGTTDLAGSQATGTDIHASGPAVHHGLYFLHVWGPCALRLDVGMADLVPRRQGLSAYLALPGHAVTSPAKTTSILPYAMVPGKRKEIQGSATKNPF